MSAVEEFVATALSPLRASGRVCSSGIGTGLGQPRGTCLGGGGRAGPAAGSSSRRTVGGNDPSTENKAAGVEGSPLPPPPHSGLRGHLW